MTLEARSTPIILVQPSATLPALMELNRQRAKDVLADIPASPAVVIEEGRGSSTAASHARQESRERHDFFAIQLGLAEQEEPQGVDFLGPWLVRGDPSEVLVLRCNISPRLMHIHIDAVSRLEAPWAPAQRLSAVETIRSNLIRTYSAQPSSLLDLASALRRAVAAEARARVTMELEELTNLASSFMSATPSGQQDSGLFIRLVAFRSRQRQLLTITARLGGDADNGLRLADDAPFLENSISDVDALGAFVANFQLLHLHRQGQEAERVTVKRNQDLSRLAAALVLPTIWVTFWSTKAAPDQLWARPLNEWPGLSTVLLGTLLVAVAAWFLVPLVLRRGRSGGVQDADA